jgi:hypothetical protein
MYDMFVILLFFPIILGISYIITRCLLRIDWGPFQVGLMILRFVGVTIHELSHFFMCIIVGVRPKSISVRLRSGYTGEVDPHGKVVMDIHHNTFLQAALISLAPLIFCTWLFFFFLEWAFNEALDPFIRIIAGFLCISIFFGATPSKPDFMHIGFWFKKDPRYSLYQIFLLLLSGCCVWAIVTFYTIVLPFDIIYYILVGIGYSVLKYGFRGINTAMYKVTHHSGDTHLRVRYGRLKRSRFKPSKPSKLGKREAPW